MRHYVNLSKRNFDLDSGFYPLGSCTMKHNPRLHERVAALPGHARLHPLQSPRRAQGALELMYNLQEALAEIAGLPHVSLQPSAGSHGELAGVLLTRAYHADRGEERTKVLTPDSAHGTNPATVTMAGYEVVKVALDADGGVDLDDLRAKTDESVACLMLTNPSTLGIFDQNIEEMAEIVHEAWARRCTTTARTSTRSWATRGPATWASTSCTSTCTRRSPSRTAAAARAPGRSPCRTASSRSCRARRSCAGRLRTVDRPSTTSTSATGRTRSRSASCAAFRATTACSCAPTPTSARWAPRG